MRAGSARDRRAGGAPATKGPGTGTDRGPVGFAPQVRLTKGEVFAACQVLADADRRLVGAGHVSEAVALGDLFELLEDRLAGVQAGSRSYSMDNEFTQ